MAVRHTRFHILPKLVSEHTRAHIDVRINTQLLNVRMNEHTHACACTQTHIHGQHTKPLGINAPVNSDMMHSQRSRRQAFSLMSGTKLLWLLDCIRTMVAASTDPGLSMFFWRASRASFRGSDISNG